MTSHHPVADLLPFYANGSLDEADRARVEAELATCATCAAELRDVTALGAALRARNDALPPFPPRVVDATLARLDATPARRFAERLIGGAWWSVPARYAIAIVLVLGVGGAAIAAYEAHQAAIAPGGTYIFRVPDANRPAADDRMEEAVDLAVRDPAHAMPAALRILTRTGTVVARDADVVEADVPSADLAATVSRLATLGTITARHAVRPARRDAMTPTTRLFVRIRPLRD